MPSEKYRYFRYDSEGRIHGAREFSASSDEAAIAQVADQHPNDFCEIWQGNRLVQAVGESSTVRAVSGSRRAIARAERFLSETADMIREPSPPASSRPS